jgi:hypothetical protein
MRVKVLCGFKFSTDGLTYTWLGAGSEHEIPNSQVASLHAEGYVEPLEALPVNPVWPVRATPIRQTGNRQNNRSNRR